MEGITVPPELQNGECAASGLEHRRATLTRPQRTASPRCRSRPPRTTRAPARTPARPNRKSTSASPTSWPRPSCVLPARSPTWTALATRTMWAHSCEPNTRPRLRTDARVARPAVEQGSQALGNYIQWPGMEDCSEYGEPGCGSNPRLKGAACDWAPVCASWTGGVVPAACGVALRQHSAFSLQSAGPPALCPAPVTHRICRVSAQTPTTRRRPAKTTADRARRTAGKAADGSRTARKDDPQPKVAARRSTCLVN